MKNCVLFVISMISLNLFSQVDSAEYKRIFNLSMMKDTLKFLSYRVAFEYSIFEKESDAGFELGRDTLIKGDASVILLLETKDYYCDFYLKTKDSTFISYQTNATYFGTPNNLFVDTLPLPKLFLESYLSKCLEHPLSSYNKIIDLFVSARFVEDSLSHYYLQKASCTVEGKKIQGVDLAYSIQDQNKTQIACFLGFDGTSNIPVSFVSKRKSGKASYSLTFTDIKFNDKIIPWKPPTEIKIPSIYTPSNSSK